MAIHKSANPSPSQEKVAERFVWLSNHFQSDLNYCCSTIRVPHGAHSPLSVDPAAEGTLAFQAFHDLTCLILRRYPHKPVHLISHYKAAHTHLMEVGNPPRLANLGTSFNEVLCTQPYQSGHPLL